MNLLFTLLSSAPHLEDLELYMFSLCLGFSSHGQFTAELCPVPMTSLLSSLAFPRLRSLCLLNAEVDIDDLLAFATRHQPTLQHLNIEDIRVVSQTLQNKGEELKLPNV